jgi:hypothetical protein
MKPVIILNLISRALAPKSRTVELSEAESKAPISQAGIKREVGLALAAFAILAALILAVIVSFTSEP